MAPVSFQFALIGRSYPCEAFEHWAKVSRATREQKRAARMGQSVSHQDNFRKQPKEAARG